MQDQFGRRIDYIRISISDRCNLRCRYCMPDGVVLTQMKELLTFEEIRQVAACAADLGIRHVKLTGGEPLVRRGASDLVRILKEIKGIEQVTLTTNGVMLEEKLPALLGAGLDAVNISLDSTDRETYRQITGTDALDQVLSAIDCACRAGIRTKVNAVSLDLGEENLWKLIGLAKERPVDVRFIEMMPIGYGKQFPVLSHQELLRLIKGHFPGLKEDPSEHGSGPAVYYSIPGYRGSVGLISAIHGKFCTGCNRVRLTSMGYLKACLCYDTGADLREILRSDLREEEKRQTLLKTMEAAIYAKPQAHCFEHTEQMTETAAMHAIGG